MHMTYGKFFQTGLNIHFVIRGWCGQMVALSVIFNLCNDGNCGPVMRESEFTCQVFISKGGGSEEVEQI